MYDNKQTIWRYHCLHDQLDNRLLLPCSSSNVVEMDAEWDSGRSGAHVTSEIK